MGFVFNIQNKGVVLYNKCLFAQRKIRLVIDYKTTKYEGHVSLVLNEYWLRSCCWTWNISHISNGIGVLICIHDAHLTLNRCQEVQSLHVSSHTLTHFLVTLGRPTFLRVFYYTTHALANRTFPLQWKCDNFFIFISKVVSQPSFEL